VNGRAKFAAATAVATFLLLLVGGLVNPTGSSLACPDWPLCFGQVMPEMTGGVLYEHSHRLVATGVGLMTVILTVLLWRTHRKLGLAALIMVCVQGTLGGLTVIFKLPAAISIAHLGLSMIFFCYLLYLTQVTRPSPTRLEVAPGLRRSFVVAAALVYAQIVLGAIVRHTESWLACRDEIPLCGGSLWPSDMGWMAQLHMGHRIFGCLVGLHVIGTGMRALKQLRGFPRFLAALAPVLVLLQVSFGVYVVWTWRTTLSVELHLGGAILLLATTFGLVLTTRAGAAERVVHAQEAHS
jgi:heme A synthase